MASVANKIRRSRESRARVKAGHRQRLALIRRGAIMLPARHGKAAPKRPRLTWADVLAKWQAKILGARAKSCGAR